MKRREQVILDISKEYRTCHSNEEEASESSLLVSSLKEELKKLPLALSFECCIYRTPERLCQQNVQAYTPQLVSIGPYHFNNNKHYANMEVVKRRYLQKFLDQTGLSLKSVIEFMKERETRIRNSYVQNIDLSSDEFVRMVLLDAIFAFTIICYGQETLKEVNDRVFRGSILFEEAGMDMLLLENQLPFFIFVDLSKLVLKVGVLTEAAKQTTCIYKHCYETFRACIKGSKLPMDIEKFDVKHILDLLRHCLLPSVSLPATNMYDYEEVIPTATQLHEVGVMFKVASDNNSLLDVQFTNGVLKIPRIYVNFRIETLFRNLLAFEQCHCDDRYITEYICLMNCLINTPKDVELLVQSKIIVNNLGDSEIVSTLFSNLNKGLTSKADNYYLCTLVKDLIEYRNYPLHKSMPILKHDYSNSPWKILSIIHDYSSPWKILCIIVALILTLLTLTHIVFSILLYFNDGNTNA